MGFVLIEIFIKCHLQEHKASKLKNLIGLSSKVDKTIESQKIQINNISRAEIKSLSSMQQDNPNIKLIESPINHISSGQLQQKYEEKKDFISEPQQYKLKEITRRLQSNLKKIETIQFKNDRIKKHNINFKMLKNSLVSSHQHSMTSNRISSNIQNQPRKQKDSYKYSTPLKKSQSISASQGVYSSGYHLSATQIIHPNSQNKTNTLETCLRDLQQIKRTIKDLKEICQNGSKYDRNLKILNSNDICSDKTHKKNTPSSVSKYNYSNYRDLTSQKKNNNRSHERLHYSDKKFNWIRNTKIQQFTIDASGQQK